MNSETATTESPHAVGVRRFLIAEYCDADIYTGWHLYLRDSKRRQQRNADNTWGWIRWRSRGDGQHPAQDVFDKLEIVIRGDGTCDDDGYAEIARRFPIRRSRVGGKPRGCIEVEVNDYGRISLPPL